jgi:hypothetical protein
MLRTITSSSKSPTIPRSAKIALVVGLFATVVASFLDKGIAHFVNPAFTNGSEKTRMVVISPQLTSNTLRKRFAGWSFMVPKDGNITATMEKALGSSLAIPDAKSDQAYTPVISEYTIHCASFNFRFESNSITKGGCAELYPSLLSNARTRDSLLVARSPNRWSLLFNSATEPYNTRVAALEFPLELDNDNQCGSYESTRLRPFGNIEDGISSFPTTSTSKCVLQSGYLAVFSLTSTRFTFAEKEYNTKLTSEIFADTSDELLLAMDESFKIKTIPPQGGVGANRSVELWLELRARNSSVDILACAYDPFRLNNVHYRNVECVYHVGHAFVVSQPFNPKIKEAAAIPKIYRQGTFMILDHLPAIQNGSHAPISLAKLRNDTAAVADYMARLGTNVYADYWEEKFYGEYEVVDVHAGLEVPFWVLVVSGIILIVSFILWQATNHIVESPYKSSLYKIMAKRMGYHNGGPVLLRTELEPHEPLELEGVELLPGESLQGIDLKHKS